MSVVYRCDGCEQIIEQDAFRFDVNVYEAADAEQPAYHPDGIVDDEPVSFTAITEFTSNAQHQFCTPSCLGAWAMNRALDTTG